MASIYLIRHGQACFGSDDYDRLSTLGHRQADVAGQYFHQTGVQFDAVYAGTLLRQNQTAEGLRTVFAERGAPLAQVIQDAGFNEVQNDEQIKKLAPLLMAQDKDVANNIAMARTDSKAMQKVLRSVYQYWVALGDAPVDASLESWKQYSTRVYAALNRVINEQGTGKNVAVFSSGGTIAAIVAKVLGLPPAGVYQLFEQVVNCSVTRLIYSGDKVSVSYFNDHSYLQLMATEQDPNGLISFR